MSSSSSSIRGIMGSLMGVGFMVFLSMIMIIITMTSVMTNNNRLDSLVSVANPILGDTCSTQSGAVERRRAAYHLREKAALAQFLEPIPCQTNNGDDGRYTSTRLASFTKGLPHDSNGFVDMNAYNRLLHATSSEASFAYDNIPLGLGAGRKLDNPQAGNAFTLIGGDSRSFTQPPAPRFDSAEQAGELVENMWMALTRDVAFDAYDVNPTVASAAADLATMSDFHGPTQASQLFRGPYDGCQYGPFISQFLYGSATYGPNQIDLRVLPPLPGRDFMTNMSDYLDVQNGLSPVRTITFGPARVYIRNGRDLSHWVHMDVLFQAYFQALLIMGSSAVPLKDNIPYVTSSLNQRGFGTWGAPFITSILPAVAHIALETVWYQKWNVHKRIRPETLAQRVHLHKTGTYNISPNGPHDDVLNSAALPAIAAYNAGALRNNGAGPISYLLPQTFPEGSPVHPSYGAGHATVAGACVTILKAFYDETWVFPSPSKPSADGLTMVPYTGDTLTLLGELNKLAWNVAVGRNMAGVHWRSDATASLILGEQVAVRFLRDLCRQGTLPEAFNGFTFTGFNGNTINVV